MFAGLYLLAVISNKFVFFVLLYNTFCVCASFVNQIFCFLYC